MSTEWAAEYAAWNVGVEQARAEYDAMPLSKGGPKRKPRIEYPLRTVQVIHSEAFRKAGAARVSHRTAV